MRVWIFVVGLAFSGVSCRPVGQARAAAGPACDSARLPAAPRDVGPEVSAEDYARVTGAGPVTLRGRTRRDRVEVVVTNAGVAPALVSRGGCEAPAVGYTSPGLGWPPAWAAYYDCTMMLVETRLGPGDSVVLAGPFTREKALGGSLPGGAYCTAAVVALNGRKLVVPAGRVTF